MGLLVPKFGGGVIWENWELRNNGDWGEWGAGMDRSRRGGMKDGDIAPKKSQEKFKTARTVQKPKNSMEIRISHIYKLPINRTAAVM